MSLGLQQQHRAFRESNQSPWMFTRGCAAHFNFVPVIWFPSRIPIWAVPLGQKRPKRAHNTCQEELRTDNSHLQCYFVHLSLLEFQWILFFLQRTFDSALHGCQMPSIGAQWKSASKHRNACTQLKKGPSTCQGKKNPTPGAPGPQNRCSHGCWGVTSVLGVLFTWIIFPSIKNILFFPEWCSNLLRHAY